MSSSRPALTIGVPVYNGARYIEGAITSVLDQDFSDWELIVADNASTDGTAEIVRSLAKDDDRIRLLPSMMNQGSAWNWNRCVHEARGPLFNWLCDDDLLTPTHSRRCVEALEAAGPEAVLAYPDAILIDADGEPFENYEDELDITSHEVTTRVETLMTKLVLINPLLAVIRTPALKRTRLMQGFAQADIVLLLELLLQGRAVKIDEPLFLRRRHPGNHMIANTTVAAMDEFYNPRNRTTEFPTWRLVRSFMEAVGAAPLSPADKAVAFALLGKTRYRKRLWREARDAGLEKRSRLPV